MYKVMLQEMCQQRRWALPKYTTVKEGAEHNPSFTASVNVNRLFFHSPSASKSSKAAQNLVARLAFLHFTSHSLNSSVCSEEANTGEPKSTAGELESTTREESNAPETNKKASDVQGLYKCQLNNYARWKNLDPPLYTCTKEGPPHALRFKASVRVDGSTFESLESFRTLKEAECATAKAAMESLSVDSSQEDGFGLYKNVLQELAQLEDLTWPVYKTINCSAPHQPLFFSRVEVEGEIFYGKAGKSRKQAEVKAAMVAYKVLKERITSQSAGLDLPSLVEKAPMPSLGPSSISSTSEPEKRLEREPHLAMTKTESGDGGKDVVFCSEDEKAISGADKTGNAKVLSEDFLSTAKVSARSPAPTPQDKLPLPVSASNSNKETDAKSYLLGNRIRVYTYFPADIEFPKCVTVLPISDNKWVAVNLEFLN